MQTRPLGRTGIPVTPLGLGLAALGRPGYINLGHAEDLDRAYAVEAMEAHCHAVLDAAFAAGIRYFDAARSYGRAEAFLGSWLEARGLTPDDVSVGSKWGYTYTAGWQVEADKHEIKEHSPAVLARQWEETSAALGRHLKLYQIHSATLDSGALDDPGVLGGLAERKAAGVAMGLTLSGADQAEVLDRAMTVRVDGVPVFDAVQATWNLLEPSCGAALARAHAAGMGVIVKEALANGRLAPRNADPAFARKRARLDAQAKRLGAGLDAVALAAVLARPWADVVLSGAATADQVRTNAIALAVSWDAEAEHALAGLAEAPRDYWRTRSGLAWN